jgi:phage shock protein A
MISIEEFERIRARIEKMKRDRDKASGAMESVMSQIKKEFGCSTLKEASKKLVKLTQEQEKLEKEIEQKEAEFQEKWADVLEELK